MAAHRACQRRTSGTAYGLTTLSGSMILSPVPPGLLATVGPVALPHQLFSAFRVPCVASGRNLEAGHTVFRTIQFVCAVMFELGPIAKGSSTLMPRIPFRNTLLLMVMLLLPPKSRIVPFVADEPTLVLPLIELFVTLPNTILSARRRRVRCWIQ